MKTTTYKTVTRKPTTADQCGYYRVVCEKGLYWGVYYVGKMWDGDKFVADAGSWPETFWFGR